LSAGSEAELRREIGWFSSFAMGYGDVGADIFVALGVVVLYAAGAAPLAFLVAAAIYVAVGLAYAELAPTYPYAGGCLVYTIRASNSLLGFMAGWAVMLDYTIDISLFSLAAAGYLKFLIPGLSATGMTISVLGIQLPVIGILAGPLVGFLLVLNYFGIRYSAGFISLLVFFGLVIEGLILGLGYLFSFDVSLLSSQIGFFGNPTTLKDVGYLGFLSIETNNFLYGLTLAMASFIGVESIAQAAEETRKPHRWIPRAAKLSVVAVLLSVMLFALLSLGVLEWHQLGAAYENPVARIVAAFPVVGLAIAPIVAFAAFILCYASSNTGVIGVSRITASMSRFALMPRWFYRIHPKHRTPTRTVLVFGSVGLALALVGDIPFIASLYNFGALLSYMILMASFVALRNRDPDAYRPWKAPLSLKFKLSNRVVDIPLVGLLGLMGTTALWVLVVLLHPLGRLFGFLWVGIGLLIYFLTRRVMGLKLVSRMERQMVEPWAYKMDIGILVRPFDDLDVVARSVKHTLDRRFRLRLVAIVDASILGPKQPGWEAEVETIRETLGSEVSGLARQLAEAGFDTTFCIHVGEFTRMVEQEMQSGNIDMLAYVKTSPEKATIEKGLDEGLQRVMLKYRGKIMALRRMGT